MKKVVMVAGPVHPVPPTKGAAVEWWMVQVCQRLKGFEPHIISICSPQYNNEEVRDGIHYHRITIGKAYKRLFQKLTRIDPFGYATRASRIIRKVRPDIVHVHNTPDVFAKIHAQCLAAGALPVLHMHNEMAFPPLPQGTQLFVVSRYLQNWYQASHPEANIKVITNGADIDIIRPLAPQPELVNALKAQHNISADKQVILYAGRMSPEKGPLDLVLTFNKLLHLRQDVCLVLVGEFSIGRDTDRRVQYGARIRQLCNTMPSHCLIIGSVSHTSMHSFYHLAQLVVIPSEFEEPFCMVAIEAMAAGAPVLAARKGGLPEFITSNQTGFFMDDTKNHETVARQIDHLLDQPILLERVKSNARRYVEQNHSWQTVCQQLESAYATLTEKTAHA